MTATIAEPGIYDIPEDQYHADPVPGGSLSASDCKVLLEDGGPAKYWYRREHPKPPTAAMELGTVAHSLVLGTGQEMAEIKADNWRGKQANEDADKARAEGRIPLLTRDVETVHAMADALRKTGKAAALLRPGRGEAEQSAFWQDPEFGIWRRCRFDFLPDWRALIVDYKTCADASPKGFAKAVDNFLYHLSADWYCDGYEAIFGERPAFALVAQEKEPPYNVAAYVLDAEAHAVGREAGRRAMRLWAECRESGEWPGYPDEIQELSLPRWSRTREDFYAS